MTDDRAAAIEALLVDASDAHHVYERDELNGVYDEDWPAWYARHVVDNGLAAVVGRELTADEVGVHLQRLSDEYSGLDPQAAESWAPWTARRLVADL